MDLDQRIAHAGSFLLQSPPGEVNDVFADCRAIINDDSTLEQGILPALERYNVEQLIVADAPGQSHQVIICKAAQLEGGEGRFVDPRSQQSFLFDHMRAELSSPEPVSYDEALQPARLALEQAATAYVEEHYNQGVSAVYAPLRPAPPPSAPVPVEEAPTPSAMDQDEPASETAEAENEETEGEAPLVQAAIPAEADAAPPPPVAAAEESLEPLPKRFQIALVGNKYNPSNFWTGRWRSLYEIDLDAATASGQIDVNVHYYEQGNVQLSVSRPVSLDAPTSSEPAALAKEVLKRLAAIEKDFQIAINEAHVDMNEKTLKDLRRNLPLTKSKLDWNRITSYRTAKELKRAE